jgi:hypothetical protein
MDDQELQNGWDTLQTAKSNLQAWHDSVESRLASAGLGDEEMQFATLEQVNDAVNAAIDLTEALTENVETNFVLKTSHAADLNEKANKVDLEALETEVSSIDLSQYATSSAVSSTYATKTELSNTEISIRNDFPEMPDVSSFVTETIVDTKISAAVSSIPGVDLSGYSTTTQMNTAISTAKSEVVAQIPNVTNFITINDVSTFVDSKGFLDQSDISDLTNAIQNQVLGIVQASLEEIEIPTVEEVGALSDDVVALTNRVDAHDTALENLAEELDNFTTDADVATAKSEAIDAAAAAAATLYSPLGHNHDGTYAALSHTHSEYSTTSHNHDASYSALGHTHSEYATTSSLSNFVTQDDIDDAIDEFKASDVFTGLQTDVASAASAASAAATSASNAAFAASTAQAEAEAAQTTATNAASVASTAQADATEAASAASTAQSTAEAAQATASSAALAVNALGAPKDIVKSVVNEWLDTPPTDPTSFAEFVAWLTGTTPLPPTPPLDPFGFTQTEFIAGVESSSLLGENDVLDSLTEVSPVNEEITTDTYEITTSELIIVGIKFDTTSTIYFDDGTPGVAPTHGITVSPASSTLTTHQLTTADTRQLVLIVVEAGTTLTIDAHDVDISVLRSKLLRDALSLQYLVSSTEVPEGSSETF